MNNFDAITLKDHADKQKPLTDECQACGTSRREMRLNDLRGCRFCRQTDPKHTEATSCGMGKLSDKYCLPLGPARKGLHP